MVAEAVAAVPTAERELKRISDTLGPAFALELCTDRRAIRMTCLTTGQSRLCSYPSIARMDYGELRELAASLRGQEDHG